MIKHGMARTDIYNVWHGMLQRCNNENSKKYMGDRVKVCDEWQTFEGFYASMGDCPDGCVLTRVDPDDGFSPDNCVWAPYGVGQHNDKLRSTNTSGVKGVHLGKRGYEAQIYVNAKKVFLGRFTTIDEAADARNAAERRYW